MLINSFALRSQRGSTGPWGVVGDGGGTVGDSSGREVEGGSVEEGAVEGGS